MKSKILTVLCFLVGIFFINAGLDKFLHYMPVPKDMPDKMVQMGKAFMQISWLMPLVGVAEILGGILLIPRKTRALGAVILVPVLIGILLTAVSSSPNVLPVIIIIIAIILWVIIDNREKYLPMVR